MATDPRVLESTPAEFCVLFGQGSGAGAQICENPDRIRSHFLFSAVAGICMFFVNVIV